MADLVAVHNGLALFRSGDLGVIVDTDDLNPFDAQPYQKVYTQLSWQPVGSTKVDPVWHELAESSFAMAKQAQPKSFTASCNISRVVRVPKNVQDNASKALTAGGLAPSTEAVAKSLAGGSITAATVMRVRNYFGTHAITATGANDFLAHGGRAGMVWAAKTGKSLLAAAGEDENLPPVDQDPEAPHLFMPDAADSEVCAICGLGEDDERHSNSGQPDALGSTKYFGVMLEDTDSTIFKMSGLFALDESGSWWERDGGDWSPAAGAPDAASLVELDGESFGALQAQIDDPDIEIAELSIAEEKLHAWAASDLAKQGETLDAIFAAAPFVDPAVRSANAKKQLRDGDGQFIKMSARIKTNGGVSGTVKAMNEDGTVDVDTGSGIEKVPADQVHKDDSTEGGQVARLSEPLELVTDVAGRIESYLESQKDKDEPGATAASAAEFADEPIPAEPVGDTPSADAPAAEAPKSEAPGGSTVEPLYLAIVDAEDTQAVLDLVALIPADPASGAQLEAYRRSEGAWAPAPDMLSKLQGSSPPPVVELDAVNLADVLSQMDPAEKSEPVAASGLRRHVINDVGALVASRVAGPVLLKPYETYPDDVTTRLGELSAESNDIDSPAANRLKRYWEKGEGAAKIRWGTDGDWTRCVNQLSKYMGPRAKGYCTLRHKGALGYYPGERDRPGNPKSGETAAQLPTLAEFTNQLAKEAGIDPTKPHEFNGPGPESDFFDGECGYCGKSIDDPIHTNADQLASGDTEAKPLVLDAELPHEPVGESPDDPCTLCGKSWDDPVHTEFGAPEQTAVATEPVPDEPIEVHVFVPSESDATTCSVCGEAQDSPSHNMPVEAMTAYAGEALFDGPIDPETGLPAEEPDWAQPHIYEADDNVDAEQCMCGQQPGGTIHIVVMPVEKEIIGGPDDVIDPGTGIVIVASAEAMNVEGGARFRISVIVPEGQESGDGRTFATESLTSRDVPLALMWQIESDEGHKRSVIVGRIDHVERLPEGGLGNAYGVFDTGEYGQEALRLVRNGMLRGISADLDEFEAEIIEPAPENVITSPKIEVKSGRLMGATLVAKPAFANCTIELMDGEDESVADGEYYEQTPEAVAASLVAAAAPVKPPKAWFGNPKLDKPTPLTIDDDGRVFGHIATWETSHIGLPYGTRPPRSVSNYQYFRTGVLRTAEGEDVPVGQLTLAGGHAPLQADANAAVKHYDDTASAWADVAAGEDRHGIWVAGAIRPDITEAQVRVARASSPSGDWRPINNALELVAACCVNVPGFPVARAMVSSGQVTALVAAGSADLAMEKALQQPAFKSMVASVESLSRLVAGDRGAAARAKLEAARAERQQALVASARARVDAVRQERELKAQADAVRERMQALVAGLRYQVPFDETKHPRDQKGRFRKVWARLVESLGMDEGRIENRALEQATKALKEASDLEDSGDNEAAQIAGEEAKAALDTAAREVGEEIKAAVVEAAEEVGEVLARLASQPGEDGGLAFADLPEEIKSMLQAFLDEIEQAADPVNVEQIDNKVRAWIEGKGFESPEAIAAMIASYLKQLVKPNPISKGGPMGITAPSTYAP